MQVLKPIKSYTHLFTELNAINGTRRMRMGAQNIRRNASN